MSCRCCSILHSSLKLIAHNKCSLSDTGIDRFGLHPRVLKGTSHLPQIVRCKLLFQYLLHYNPVDHQCRDVDGLASMGSTGAFS